MKPMKKVLVAAALVGTLVSGFALAQAAPPGPTPASQPANPLMEFGDLIVGRWMSEITWAADYPGLGKKGEQHTGFDVWSWVADGAALECDWVLGPTAGRWLVWWDPSTEQIRVLEVDSGRNWAQGTITKQGTTWMVSRQGTFADGRPVEYQFQMSFQDDGQTHIDTGVTILEGTRSEFRDVYRRVGR
jgi:hypothetical protein